MNKIITTIQSLWNKVMTLASNPWVIIEATKKSPLALVLAVVFVVQPILSFGFSILDDIVFVKQKLDPTLRPVTVGELRLLNQKIDALEAMIEKDRATDKRILRDMSNEVAADAAPTPNIAAFKKAQDDLDVLQNTLDQKYKVSTKK
jgi:hypothetical protein